MMSELRYEERQTDYINNFLKKPPLHFLPSLHWPLYNREEVREGKSDLNEHAKKVRDVKTIEQKNAGLAAGSTLCFFIL